jgi:DNA polymerase I
MPMIHRMAQRGLQVDLSHFAKLDKGLTQDMDRVTEEVRSISGHYINLGSGEQVANLLFKILKLKQVKVKMTPSGDRESVEDAVLVAIQHEHPAVSKCLEYKEYEKLRGTYVRPMPRLAKRVGLGKWRLYPNFRVTRVPTGRFATANPNLLAMPTRTERGRDIRKGFITDDGWVMLSVDESQIEPRIAAHRSRDTNLINVYKNGEDIYSDFAISAFKLLDKRFRDDTGWHYPGVDKMEHRRPSKICVLASIYDVTAGGLQDQLPVICANCNQESSKHTCKHFRPLWLEGKCQGLLDSFYTRYPGLMRMRIDDHHYMRRTATMIDMFGRILHVQAVRSVLPWVVNSTLREGANFPIQASANGTLRLTMAAVDDDLTENRMYGDAVYPLLPIHDEILFECREDVAQEVGELTKYRFQTCCELAVPIEAAAVTASTWGDLPK